jgi:hypothetical protein
MAQGDDSQDGSQPGNFPGWRPLHFTDIQRLLKRGDRFVETAQIGEYRADLVLLLGHEQALRHRVPLEDGEFRLERFERGGSPLLDRRAQVLKRTRVVNVPRVLTGQDDAGVGKAGRINGNLVRRIGFPDSRAGGLRFRSWSDTRAQQPDRNASQKWRTRQHKEHPPGSVSHRLAASFFGRRSHCSCSIDALSEEPPINTRAE